MPPARPSNFVTIWPSCLKGEGGGVGQKRFCESAGGAASATKSAHRRSREQGRIGVPLDFKLDESFSRKRGVAAHARAAGRPARSTPVRFGRLCIRIKTGL